MIFIVIIGSIEGPILGAVVYFVLRGLFADYGAWYQLLLGAIAIAVMLWSPQGL